MLCFKTLSTHKLNKLLSNSIHKNIKSKRKRKSLDLSKCKLFANPLDVNRFVDENTHQLDLMIYRAFLLMDTNQPFQH